MATSNLVNTAGRAVLAATLAAALVPVPAFADALLAAGAEGAPLAMPEAAGGPVASLTQGADAVRAAAARAAVDDSIAWYVEDPTARTFELLNGTELAGLSDLVAGRARGADGALIPAQTFEGVTFLLRPGASDTGGTCNLGAVEWKPIGTAEHPFEGTFDGCGATVIGLKITGASGTRNQGLFGYTGAHSSLKNLVLLSDAASPSSVAITTAAAVENVGTLAGYAGGTVENCVSSVPVTVNSTLQATAALPWVVRNVGGVAGTAIGDMTDCHYTAEGGLSVTVASDVIDPTGTDLRVSDSFGGVVGRFGEVWPADGQLATLRGCTNRAAVTVVNNGGGAKDNFGTATYARSAFVGGVCGYSNGNLVECQNGTYNNLKWESDGNVTTLSDAQWAKRFTEGQGGEKVGGVVGSVRGASDGSRGLSTDDPNYRYNDGCKDFAARVENCHNVGMVVGCVSVGGIAGDIGSCTTLTQCRNGLPGETSLGWTESGAGAKIAGHVICNRWNKPISGGIVGRAWASTVSLCANYGDVENTKTGYYTAGICGALWKADDKDVADVQGELYSCLNTGKVYTANENAAVEFREAAILGNNEGYVHDCIYLEGCVPFHKDAAIGASTWGNYANLQAMDQKTIGTSESAAKLNAPLMAGSLAEEPSCYWFVNRSGYPVLNVWAETVDKVQLTSSAIASVEQLRPAAYVGLGDAHAPGPVPTLSVTLQDGTVLYQGSDFYVRAQPGAWQRTDTLDNPTPYTATIAGLGMYAGEVAWPNCYGIGQASLSEAKVEVAPSTYCFGRVVLPETVNVAIGGLPIDAAQYDYVIYDSATDADSVKKGGVTEKSCLRVFDSAGFVDWGDGQLVALETVPDAIERLNSSTGWKLYDRGGYEDANGKVHTAPLLLSDSTGAVYIPGSANPLPGRSCVELKSGTPAGYVVRVAPSESSDLEADSSAIGYFVIDSLNLRTECSFDAVTIAGQPLQWDNDHSELYALDESGAPILAGPTDDKTRRYALPQVTFTGKTVTEDAVALSYGDYQLRQGTDFRVIYGDPDPANVEYDTDSSAEGEEAATAPNRNVTAGAVRAALTIAPVSTKNLSNYFIAYFGIAPASLNDCAISGAGGTYDYTGKAICPTVKVTLNGVTMVEGVDYTLSYANNVNAGTASFTVTPLANLNAAGTKAYTGTFTIKAPPAPSVTTGQPAASGATSPDPATPAATAPKAPTLKFSKTSVTTAAGAKAFANKLSCNSTGKVTYKSSNTKVVKVSAAGKVTVVGPGKATITATVAATSAYKKATKSYAVKVAPKKQVVKKATGAKKKVTVKWTRDANAAKYQVQVSTSKNFTAKTTITKSASKSKVSLTVSKLKAKKTYYVRVRTYHKTGGWGNWSAKQKVKTK